MKKQELMQSMFHAGHCVDNGPTEGFERIIESEMYYLHIFHGEIDLRSAIEKYTHFYNQCH